ALPFASGAPVFFASMVYVVRFAMTLMRLLAALGMCALALGASAIADEPPAAAPMSDAERAVKMVPTKIEANYAGGELTHLMVRGRMAYLVKPTGKVDPQKRWLWDFPFWL